MRIFHDGRHALAVAMTSDQGVRGVGQAVQGR